MNLPTVLIRDRHCYHTGECNTFQVLIVLDRDLKQKKRVFGVQIYCFYCICLISLEIQVDGVYNFAVSPVSSDDETIQSIWRIIQVVLVSRSCLAGPSFIMLKHTTWCTVIPLIYLPGLKNVSTDIPDEWKLMDFDCFVTAYPWVLSEPGASYV